MTWFPHTTSDFAVWFLFGEQLFYQSASNCGLFSLYAVEAPDSHMDVVLSSRPSMRSRAASPWKPNQMTAPTPSMLLLNRGVSESQNVFFPCGHFESLSLLIWNTWMCIRLKYTAHRCPDVHVNCIALPKSIMKGCSKALCQFKYM